MSNFPRPHGKMSRVVYARGRPGDLYFWPYREVAMIRDEGTGRLEVTSADGVVAHAVGVLSSFEDPIFFEAQPGVLVNPAHVRALKGHELHLPGGWRIPFKGALPPAVAEKPSQMPGTAVSKDDVLYIRVDRKKCVLVTEKDEIPLDVNLTRAAAAHGDIMQLKYEFLNRRRIRSIRPRNGKILIALDTGREFSIYMIEGPSIRKSLGLAPSRVEDARLAPDVRALFTLELRDYPFDLLEAKARTLRELFGTDVTMLVTHVVWQIIRARKLGRTPDVGRTMRAFWYRPMFPLFVRAGLVGGGPGQRTTDNLYVLYLHAFDVLVGKYRLCNYQDIGFVDHRPDLRAVGSKRPAVVVLCEKNSLMPFVQRLAQRFGVSWHVSNGMSKLFAAELFAADLLAAGIPKITLIAYVDYDPAGWSIARNFARQLGRFGVETAKIKFLILPKRFTAEERAKLWHRAKKVRQPNLYADWMKETGGIDGKPRGIYSNHLVPYERVEKAMSEALRGLG